jgi:hypothetical protein
VSTAPWPGPLRRFVEQLAGLRSAGVPDLEEVGRLLVELTSDEDFFDPLIAELPLLLFDRAEYDPAQGTCRALAPGDPGRSNR